MMSFELIFRGLVKQTISMDAWNLEIARYQVPLLGLVTQLGSKEARRAFLIF
jgi:hypothetical protein